MNAVISLVLAEEGAVSWWNYPGMELWKFVNLLLFVIAGIYILRRPMSDALKGRRERIKQELQKAQRERDEALSELQQIEARLSKLDEEVDSIRKQAQAESAAERERLNRETTAELTKLRESAQREIEGAGKVARQQLREFAAQQSLRLAEEAIRREIRPDDDARLIHAGVEQLGGSRN